MNKYLISFGSNGYQNTLNDLKTSAVLFFNDIFIYGENDIIDLKKMYEKHFDNGRGYGYWLWKPYLILKTLEKINNGDILMYVDATMKFIDNPQKIFSLLEDRDIVLFSSEYKNYQFTKYDTFFDLNLVGDKFINGKHVNAAIILIKKTENSVNFIRQFFEYCKNYHIISDEPNIKGENYLGFVDHRHDQSILSLLVIKNDIELYRDPTQWGESHKNLFTNSNYNTLLNHHRTKY